MGDENTLAGTTKAHKHSATSSDGGFLETTVTGITNLSTGSIVYGDASEIVTELTAGSSTDVLTIDGSGLPSWVSPAGLPAGALVMWSGLYNSIPSGWLLCDGSEINRTTYADLFSAIGTQFGSAGASTFTLPLFQNIFPRSPASSTSCGATGGADSLTLSTAQMPTHTHVVNDSGHTHIVPLVDAGGGSEPRVDGGHISYPKNVTTTSNTTGITLDNTGSSNSFDNRPAYLEILFIIKT